MPGQTNASGTTVVSYAYDPYGKLLSTTGTLATTLGTYNPLRYRGYVYDHETGLYYLQSRYYDPAIGRFINADTFASTGQGILGNNMFAYCLNNPVNYSDSSGEAPVPSLSDYYGMHKSVQYDIAEQYGYAIEVFVISGKRIGYLDIYDFELGAYYEVKHRLAASGKHFDQQMQKYDSSHIADWRFLGTNVSIKPMRGSKIIIGETEYLYWDIHYRTRENGVIIYWWSLNSERYSVFLASVAVAGLNAFSRTSIVGGSAKGAKREAFSSGS